MKVELHMSRFLIFYGVVFQSFCFAIGSSDNLIETFSKGNYHTILQAVEQRIDFNKPDEKGSVPLLRICENESLSDDQTRELVSKCVEEKGANVKFQHLTSGKTALHLAASWNKIKTMEVLLDHAADINAQDKIWSTPLIFASSFDGNQDSIKLLARRGAELNAVTKSDNRATFGGKMTALHYAAQEGHAANILALIEAGADTKLKTEKGYTALDYLVEAKEDKKINDANYEFISQILSGTKTTDHLADEVSKLNLSAHNPLYDLIIDDRISSSEIGNYILEKNLIEEQLRLGFEQLLNTARKDYQEIASLFKGKLVDEVLKDVVNKKILNIEDNLSIKKEELTRLEKEEYEIENPNIDLNHGDWADKAQSLADMKYHMEMKPYRLKENQKSMKTVKQTIDGIQERIRELKSLKTKLQLD